MINAEGKFIRCVCYWYEELYQIQRLCHNNEWDNIVLPDTFKFKDKSCKIKPDSAMTGVLLKWYITHSYDMDFISAVDLAGRRNSFEAWDWYPLLEPKVLIVDLEGVSEMLLLSKVLFALATGRNRLRKITIWLHSNWQKCGDAYRRGARRESMAGESNASEWGTKKKWEKVSMTEEYHEFSNLLNSLPEITRIEDLI